MSALAVAELEDVSSGAVKVLIADDHPLMVAGIRRALERSDDIAVVGEAHSGPELIDMIGRRLPDLVLMDLRMPGVAGSDCIQQIRAEWPELKIVVLSASDDRASIDGALGAGANAYVIKSVASPDLISLVRQTANGSVFHSSSAPHPAPFGQRAPDAPEAPRLTERERVILSAVAAGMTSSRISAELWLSEHTVKFHLTNIYRKLGVRNRAAAVRYALAHGLAEA